MKYVSALDNEDNPLAARVMEWQRSGAGRDDPRRQIIPAETLGAAVYVDDVI